VEGIVLTPNCATSKLVISRYVECVVDGGHHGEEVCQDSQDLIGNDGILVMGVSLGEGID
jgi:hypothetical protein